MKTLRISMSALAAIVIAGAIFYSCQKEESNTIKDQTVQNQFKYSDSWFSVNDVCYGEQPYFCFTYSGNRTTVIGIESYPGANDWVQLYQKPNSAQYCDFLPLTEPGTYSCRYSANGQGGVQNVPFTVTISVCDCENWQTESAFGGESAGGGNNWWFYYDGDGEQTIWAGQDINIGTVNYDGNSIVISFTGGWQLNDVTDAVKIYGFENVPDDDPNPGQNPGDLLYHGDELTVSVGEYNIYVIHLDVRLCLD